MSRCVVTAKEAVIIDSVDLTADRDLTTMTEMGLRPLFALSTHVHADHITGTQLEIHMPPSEMPSLHRAFS